MTTRITSAKKLAAVLAATLVVVSVVSVGLAGSAAAQGMDEEDNQPTVRVLHASPDAGPVDIYVDGSLAVGNVAYGGHATTSLSPGNHSVTLTEAGNEEAVVVEGNVTLEAGTRYTVAASGEVGEDAATSLELTVFQSDEPVPADDETAVRLAHLSPDAGPVDVTLNETGEVVFDNVTFRNATEFVTLPAAEYALDVREATETNDGPIVQSVTLVPSGGTVVSAFAVGYVSPDGEDERTAFRVLELRDAGAEPAEDNESEETPSETAPGTDAGTVTTTPTEATG